MLFHECYFDKAEEFHFYIPFFQWASIKAYFDNGMWPSPVPFKTKHDRSGGMGPTAGASQDDHGPQ